MSALQKAMYTFKLPSINLKPVKNKFKDKFNELAKGGFEQIFKRIDQLGIKKGVDQLGLDKFINQCALLAAGSGLLTGTGGVATMAVGVPLDMINLITQQFRVTMAVSYYHTGAYKVSFEDFFKIVASSLKVDAGMTVSKKVMEEVAEKLMVNIGSKTAERLVPVVGAVIGGSANYLFIKRVGESVKGMYPKAGKVIKI
ncbi:hypothetical protein GCM10027037_29350 [Mucilaginibacter koreensis]